MNKDKCDGCADPEAPFVLHYCEACLTPDENDLRLRTRVARAYDDILIILQDHFPDIRQKIEVAKQKALSDMYGDRSRHGDRLMTLSGKPEGSEPATGNTRRSAGIRLAGGNAPIDQRREGLPASVSDDRDGSRTSGFDSHLSPEIMGKACMFQFNDSTRDARDERIIELERLCNDGEIREMDLAFRLQQAEDDLAFIRDDWSPFGARPCPVCVYEDGWFKRHCKLHEELHRVEVEADEYLQKLFRTKRALRKLRAWEERRDHGGQWCPFCREQLLTRDSHEVDCIRFVARKVLGDD